jgi:peptidoglycan/LPS O-acetylase OafA/YrhL
VGAITSIFLVQAWFPGSYPVYSYNSVAWSLSCEAFFYALLPLLLFVSAAWGGRKVVGTTVAILGAGLLATVILVHTGHGTGIAYHDPLVRLPEFIVGVLLGVLVLRGWRPSFPMWQALALVIVSAAAAHHWAVFFKQPLNDYLLLPGIVGLLLSGIGLDLRGRRGLLTARVSVYLGELSFCFYLIHLLVLFAVVRAAGWSHERFSVAGGVLPLATALAASIGAAAVMHHSIELPMQRILRPRRPAPVPT